MPEDEETFDPQQEFTSLKQQYEEDSRQDTINLLLCGEMGSGKTHILKTARKPVHVDSFDDGGTKTLRNEIQNGTVFADTSFEDENPMNPHSFRRWVKEFNRRKKGGYYENLGTYALDSLTSWQSALMNYILEKDGVAGQTPRFTKDYMPHRTKTENFVKRILSLPCDVVITAHLSSDKDEVDGRIQKRLMATGDATINIPKMFDEVWVMDPKKQGDSVTYRVLTESTGTFLARSRLASNGDISTYEQPHIKKILNKAGMRPEDKDIPELGNDEE